MDMERKKEVLSILSENKKKKLNFSVGNVGFYRDVLRNGGLKVSIHPPRLFYEDIVSSD